MKDKIKFEIYLNGNTHLHMSNGNLKVGKGIYCLNTLAGDEPLKKKNGTQLTNISGTCGGCCDSCKGNCYAIKTQIFRNNNIPQWAENTILAKEYPHKLFEELREFLNREFVSAVRYHSFGEIPSEEYLSEMIDIAKDYPNIRFYTYTKRYEWVEKRVFDIPDNLVINVSIWKKNYNNPYNLPEFIYDDGTDESLRNVPHCPATDINGHETGITCSMCKKCIYATKGSKTAVYAH